MIRDPLFRDIDRRLAEPLDGDLFERSAVDLLRQAYPGLVPIRGGGDAGMDGAVGDGEGTAFPLVCTTQASVISNLTRSLESYIKEGGTRRRVVLATSQSLTPKKRRNLEGRSQQLGFTLVQIHDHDDFVDRLYRSPQWRRELLGLTGDPPALSALPPSHRPVRGDLLIGREEDLRWLKDTAGDLLVIGQPGSGKSFLLRELTKSDDALFVVDGDRGRIADAIRYDGPRILIVDDAHTRRDALRMLRHLREDIGADFRIIISSWPGARVDLASELGVGGDSIRQLRLLTRDEILSVVRASGIAGPHLLLRELVTQSAGKPGLAVTLAHLCLAGDVQQVALGEALSQDIRHTFEPILGTHAVTVLSAFSIGGAAGMSMEAVATCLGEPVTGIRDTVAQLAAGGLVHEQGATLTVHPRRLRHVLVRDTFFAGATSVPVEPFLPYVGDDHQHTILVLIGAMAVGGRGNERLVKDLLLRCDADEPWAAYASLGKAECRWALSNRQTRTHALVWPALRMIPGEAIPLLLDWCADAEPSASRTRDTISDWIASGEPGALEAVTARAILLSKTAAWHSAGGSASVAVTMVCTAMSPAFGDSQSDPGSGRTVTIRQGYLTPPRLCELQSKWPVALEILSSANIDDWKPVRNLIQTWAHPRLSGRALSDDVYDSMRLFAARMLCDVARISEGHLGFFRSAQDLAEDLGVELPAPADREFGILFPRERWRGDWRKRMTESEDRARSLATEWLRLSPSVVSERIASFRRQAEQAGIMGPRLDHLTCYDIAQRTDVPQEWAEALLAASLPGDLLRPFLEKAVALDPESAQPLLLHAYSRPELRPAALAVAIPSPRVPDHIVSDMIEQLDGPLSETVHILCRGTHLPDSRLTLLLRHPERSVASAAALGEWFREPEGQVRAAVRDAWRQAVVASLDDGYGLEDIFESDPSIAFEWLEQRIKEPPTDFLRDDSEALVAIGHLTYDQRKQLLRQVDGRLYRESWIRGLVGNVLHLFMETLRPDLPSFTQLAALKTTSLDVAWSDMALVALEAGHSPEEVAHATFGQSWGWSGNESDMWREWVDRFESVIVHSNPLIQDVGRQGLEWTRERMRLALDKEGDEAVFGE